MSERARNRSTQGGLAAVSVLIVDDSQSMRELMKAILRELGVTRIYQAVDGADGITALRDHKPDIVFVDWMMTPLDGYDFVRLVRKSPDSPNRTVPIVMLTGHSEIKRVRAARDIGVTEFLAKPVSARAVAQRIESIIHRDRPYVQTREFFGPDRRRKVASFEGADQRGKPGGRERIVSPDELKSLLTEESPA